MFNLISQSVPNLIARLQKLWSVKKELTLSSPKLWLVIFTLLSIVLICLALVEFDTNTSSIDNKQLKTVINFIEDDITTDELAYITQHIFLNETSGEATKFIYWDDKEDFLSMGIGHFIWFPYGKNIHFEEIFPSFLVFLQENNITLPNWLERNTSAPWNNKQEFIEAHNTKKYADIKQLVVNTKNYQVKFMLHRLQQTMQKMLRMNKLDARGWVNYTAVYNSPQGKYALIDYLNFKGSGMQVDERYNEQGWGLLQVINSMNIVDNKPMVAFVESAKKLLRLRVKNSPQKKQEQKWLQGWINRINTYMVLKN